MSDPDAKKIIIEVRGGLKLPLLRELADEFLPPDEYEMISSGADASERTIKRYYPENPGAPEHTGNTEKPENGNGAGTAGIPDIILDPAGDKDKEEINRELFSALSGRTGIRPEWGTLTGVRPVKLAAELQERYGNSETARDILIKERLLTPEKADLVTGIAERQREWAGEAPKDSLGIYIGIPFCPTRCLYCSFASNQVPHEEIARYIPALFTEIRYCGKRMRDLGLTAETVYVGGGTPTTLAAEELDRLMEEILLNFSADSLREFSVEAGRPDTIDQDKLAVLKNAGVNRISINPQSMKQKTLDRIGRSHTPEDIETAFEKACSAGFSVINADLIAGLPGEDTGDFSYSLDRIISLGANNITIHTLSVKRASRLMDIDRNYHYKAAGTVSRMLSESRAMLDAAGFLPYYLYRQKHMAGNFENTGYALPGTEGLYNMRIMDEHQSILALGAGGISKKYEPSLNRLTRTPNVTNYQQYISRIDEMCERKEQSFFS